MDPVVLPDVVDELREPQDEADEIELALGGQQRRVRAVRIDPPLGGGAQDARDARVRVLHVVDGVLVRLLHRELEIEVELAVGARLKEEVTRRVLADGFDDLLEQEELIRTPLHPLENTLLQEAHVLVEDDLEFLEQTQCLHRCAHLDEVVVGIGSPDVDFFVELPVTQRLDVVGDVLPEIARFAVRANEDPTLLVLDRLARLEPHRAVLVVDLAELAELRERLLEVPRPHHLGLREPRVVRDAQHGGHPLGFLQDPLDAFGREAFRLLVERELHPLVAIPRLDPSRDVLHVVGGIGVRRDLDLLAVELPVADRDRAAERDELRPGVLDVVLALDSRAGELENRRQHVTERPAAGIRYGERPGRIRGDELDLHALAGKRLRATEVRSGAHDLVDLTGEPLLVEADVHEAAQLVHGGDRRSDTHPPADRLGDVARRLAHLLRELQRDGRRVVAVVRISGTLHLNRHTVDVGPSELGRGTREAVLDRGRDLVTQKGGHPRESGTARVGTPTSPLGSCLANRRQVRSAANPYATTSVIRFAVKPSGPSRARIAPERIAPTAFAALHARAKTAFAPARSAGVNDESWKAFTVPLAPNMRKCRTPRAPTAIGSAPVKAATSAKGNDSVSTRTIDGIAPRRAATNRPCSSAPMLPATASTPSTRPSAENGTP